jgi:methylated-DNA-[protein]-cysteine S-methyltransferase
VWNELLKIPFGQTASYLEMAKRLGDEKCIRAAASANGKNPIAVVIPCHRVIGTGGKLVGYGGGLWRKKILLQHEMAFVKQEGLLF